jgi:hypothetical protein
VVKYQLHIYVHDLCSLSLSLFILYLGPCLLLLFGDHSILKLFQTLSLSLIISVLYLQLIFCCSCSEIIPLVNSLRKSPFLFVLHLQFIQILRILSCHLIQSSSIHTPLCFHTFLNFHFRLLCHVILFVQNHCIQLKLWFIINYLLCFKYFIQ